jgi:hypothetical protein
VETHGKVIAFENYGTGIRSVHEANRKPLEMVQYWPNPFSHLTQFEFHLSQPDYVRIAVFDLAGKKVKTISDKAYEAGSYTLTWDGTGDSHQKLPAGIYILRLDGKHSFSSVRMVLLE